MVVCFVSVCCTGCVVRAVSVACRVCVVCALSVGCINHQALHKSMSVVLFFTLFFACSYFLLVLIVKDPCAAFPALFFFGFRRVRLL